MLLNTYGHSDTVRLAHYSPRKIKVSKSVQTGGING